MDVDQVNLVKGKWKKGKSNDGEGKKNEKAKGQGDERRCASTATGRDTSSPTVHRGSSTTRKKSDSKSLSSTDNVMLVTLAATAQENESNDELWIFALAVGGSLGTGTGALGAW